MTARKIVKTTLIPGTRSGNECLLECGHVVATFGDLGSLEGQVSCPECDGAEHTELTFPVMVELGADGRFQASLQDAPDVMAHGATEEEAVAKLRDRVGALVEDAEGELDAYGVRFSKED